MNELEKELNELRETHLRMAEHLGVSPNVLLKNYFDFGEKAIKELKNKQEKLNKIKELIFGDEDFDEYFFEQLEKILND